MTLPNTADIVIIGGGVMGARDGACGVTGDVDGFMKSIQEAWNRRLSPWLRNGDDFYFFGRFMAVSRSLIWTYIPSNAS